MRTATRIALGVLLLLTTLWARDAEATVPCQRFCECPTVLSSTTPAIYFPIDFGLDLPLNGRILVGPPFTVESFSWVDAAGTAVPFDVVPLEGSDSVWIVPRSPLTPGTSYVLDNPRFAYPREFRSTSAADTVAPTIASASLVPAVEPPCDPLAVGRAAITVDETPTGPGILGDYVLLDVRVVPADGRPEVRYWTATSTGTSELAIGAAIGGGVCAHDYPGSTSTFPGAAVGDLLNVTVSAIDAGGNASAPFTLAPLTLGSVAAGPSERSGACCGCRAGAPRTSPTVLALLSGAIAVFVVRRRRR